MREHIQLYGQIYILDPECYYSYDGRARFAHEELFERYSGDGEKAGELKRISSVLERCHLKEIEVPQLQTFGVGWGHVSSSGDSELFNEWSNTRAPV